LYGWFFRYWKSWWQMSIVMNQALFNPIKFSVLVPSWNLYFHLFLIFFFLLVLWSVEEGAMVFKATFNNISVTLWQSVLLVEETGVPRENHRPAASHWQTLSHNVVSGTWSFDVSQRSDLFCYGWLNCQPALLSFLFIIDFCRKMKTKK
jgi:hypothetical protein